jgi:hypothetical protein
VFVDYAAEFYYGTMVFLDLIGGSLKPIGDLDWVAIDEEDGNPVSPVPFVRLAPTPGGFSISFDRKLYKPTRDGSVGKGQMIRYSYDPSVGKLKREK